MSEAIVDAVKKYRSSINIDVLEDLDHLEIRVVETPSNTLPKDIFEDITFKVQIAASGNKLDTKPYNFKGLENVTRSREDGLYKYYIGATSSYEEIKKIHQLAKDRGFSSSYITAFKNGEKIEVKEALKTRGN